MPELKECAHRTVIATWQGTKGGVVTAPLLQAGTPLPADAALVLAPSYVPITADFHNTSCVFHRAPRTVVQVGYAPAEGPEVVAGALTISPPDPPAKMRHPVLRVLWEMTTWGMLTVPAAVVGAPGVSQLEVKSLGAHEGVHALQQANLREVRVAWLLAWLCWLTVDNTRVTSHRLVWRSGRCCSWVGHLRRKWLRLPSRRLAFSMMHGTCYTHTSMEIRRLVSSWQASGSGGRGSQRPGVVGIPSEGPRGRGQRLCAGAEQGGWQHPASARQRRGAVMSSDCVCRWSTVVHRIGCMARESMRVQSGTTPRL